MKKGTNVEYTTFSAYVHLSPSKKDITLNRTNLFKNKPSDAFFLSKVGREYLFWEKRCERAWKCHSNGK